MGAWTKAQEADANGGSLLCTGVAGPHGWGLCLCSAARPYQRVPESVSVYAPGRGVEPPQLQLFSTTSWTVTEAPASILRETGSLLVVETRKMFSCGETTDMVALSLVVE